MTYVFFIVSINGLLLLHFYKWRTGIEPCMTYVFFIVSINGLLLLHFYKWRTGIEPCMTYGLFSLSPLMIATSTLLQMENGHRTVYNLWFLLIVSIDGLLLLHFYKWRMGM